MACQVLLSIFLHRLSYTLQQIDEIMEQIQMDEWVTLDEIDFTQLLYFAFSYSTSSLIIRNLSISIFLYFLSQIIIIFVCSLKV